MRSLHLNTSYRTQLILGLIIAIWLVAFLVFIGPFDTAELPLRIRMVLLPPYGLLFLVCYGAILPLQNWLYQKVQRWTLALEIFILLCLYLLNLFANFLYYRTSWINGEYGFYKFATEIYLPSLVIMTGFLVFGRWFIGRKTDTEQPAKNTKLVLRGDNKTDLLQLEFAQLIGVSAAQNYVEIFYLHQDQPSKKLLRMTLKQVLEQVPALVRIHRSHLINPNHVVGWSGANRIIVHQLELPVSPTYKKNLESHL